MTADCAESVGDARQAPYHIRRRMSLRNFCRRPGGGGRFLMTSPWSHIDARKHFIFFLAAFCWLMRSNKLTCCQRKPGVVLCRLQWKFMNFHTHHNARCRRPFGLTGHLMLSRGISAGGTTQYRVSRKFFFRANKLIVTRVLFMFLCSLHGFEWWRPLWRLIVLLHAVNGLKSN